MPDPGNTLTPYSAGSFYVGTGAWTAGTVQTNPADTAVLADTGALPAGNYLVGVTGCASAAEVYDVQHRNAANAATLKTQRRRVRALDNDDFLFPNKITLALNERIRVVQAGALVGEIQVSIFAVPVL